jgi:hypothetical protein
MTAILRAAVSLGNRNSSIQCEHETEIISTSAPSEPLHNGLHNAKSLAKVFGAL